MPGSKLLWNNLATNLLPRFALFLVYFWFGGLKLLGVSPAGPMVESLFEATLSWLMPFHIFYLLFSAFEVLLGIMFLIRGLEKFALVLLVLHLVTTLLPLLFLPSLTWQGFLTPSLEGQYIIKNILILSTALTIYYNRKSTR